MSLSPAVFDIDWVRFCICGTLLTFRCVADYVNRRRGRKGVPSPKWMHVLLTVVLLVFYGFIRPAGGALLGGYGNLAGMGLVMMSLALGMLGPVPTALVWSRALFYCVLPLAVGVPWGFAVLSLPVAVAIAVTHRGSSRRVAAEGVTVR